MKQVPNVAVPDRSKYFIRPKKVSSPSARLVAFPYAGSGAIAYYSWADHLPPGIELISIQYPGRGRLADMSACTRLNGLVSEAYATLLTLLDVPLYFFGHSMGALVAYELVRLLRANGRKLPKALVVSACEAPQPAFALKRNLHTLPDEAFLAGLMRYGGMPAEILESPEMMAYVMQLLRADMTALETWDYKPEAPLTIPIVALGGDGDPIVRISQLQRWRDFTASSFECLIMPGSHFYFQNQLPELMSTINRVIGQTISSYSQF